MIPQAGVKNVLEMFSGKRVLVAGDLVLDHYLEGTVGRVSPEAPVPVVSLGEDYQKWIPGGAANVALNVVSLGGRPLLAGVVGGDTQGELLLDLLAGRGVDVGGVVVDGTRPTTVKTRVMARNQQLIRIDREKTGDISRDVAGVLMERIRGAVGGVHGIILEDYNKGVLTAELIGEMVLMANESGLPVSVDPKSRNFWEYRGVHLFKPNLHEAEAALGMEAATPEKAILAARTIMDRNGAGAVLITLGALGSVLLEGSTGGAVHIPAAARHVFDVSGAGDSVIAVMGLASCCGLSLLDAAITAGLAAAAVCAEPGVYAVKPEDILREARRFEE